MGAQQALYILADLLINKAAASASKTRVIRTRATSSRSNRRRGAAGGRRTRRQTRRDLNSCEFVYVTPSHQSPTTVTMPLERREHLLKQAEKHDFLIIEDDYESEINFVGEPTPALKSLDASGRVIYVGSLSKTLAPGLRLGYMVASESA